MELVLIFVVVWLLILSYFTFKTRNHYLKLLKRSGKNNIEDILERFLQNENLLKDEILKLKNEILRIEKESVSHLQKVGFLRFNPFDRVGGDQSFVMAILNKEDSGIIINYLYTREGVRIYSKRVIKGKGEDYELSTEEIEAVKKAY